MADSLTTALAKVGFETQQVYEADLTDELVSEQDLCISFGGNNTFLKTAMHLKQPKSTLIYGVQSVPKGNHTMCQSTITY